VKRVHWCAVLGLSALWLGACSTRTYDLVIANGHVMDPESGFDRVAHVAQPGLALGGTDAKANMPHAQPRVAPLLAVRAGPTPVLGQEQRQVAFWRRQILWIERP